MKTLRIVGGLLLVLAVVAACMNAQMSESQLVSNFQPAQDITLTTGTLNGASEPVPASEAEFVQQPVDDTVGIERVILKNASLTITVAEPVLRINEIAALAETMGGWVVSSNTVTSSLTNGETVTSGTVVISVPAFRLNEAMEQIKSDTLSVDNENITGQDVTQEYVDTSSRLKNLQATEEQLLRVMDSAVKVEDVLAVQRELTTVRSEIEVLQGRINYFDEAAAFSSIRVDVRPQVPDPVTAQSLGWSPVSTAENALGALVRVLQLVVDLAIVLIIVGIPLALIIGVPALLFWRNRRRFAFRKLQSPN